MGCLCIYKNKNKADKADKYSNKIKDNLTEKTEFKTKKNNQ